MLIYSMSVSVHGFIADRRAPSVDGLKREVRFQPRADTSILKRTNAVRRVERDRGDMRPAFAGDDQSVASSGLSTRVLPSAETRTTERPSSAARSMS